MSDIYKGELQDNEGNTIYPHTEADVVFCADGKTMQEKITSMESVTDGVTGRTDSLEINDSNVIVTSKATHELAQMQGGNILTYNESEDAYYIQHGADSVPKKLGSVDESTINIVSKKQSITGSGNYAVSEIPSVDSLACISVEGGGGSDSIGTPIVSGGEKVADNIYKVMANNEFTITVPANHNGTAWGIVHVAIVFIPI